MLTLIDNSQSDKLTNKQPLDLSPKWLIAFFDPEGNGMIDSTTELTDEQLTYLIHVLIEHKKKSLKNKT
jgi:hypothetical protein